MNIRLNDFRYEAVIFIDTKLSALSSNKPPSSYNQTPYDLIKWSLLNSPAKNPHASKFTKHISSMNLEGETLIQIKK